MKDLREKIDMAVTFGVALVLAWIIYASLVHRQAQTALCPEDIAVISSTGTISQRISVIEVSTCPVAAWGEYNQEQERKIKSLQMSLGWFMKQNDKDISRIIALENRIFELEGEIEDLQENAHMNHISTSSARYMIHRSTYFKIYDYLDIDKDQEK